jgi:hypothetical protein
MSIFPAHATSIRAVTWKNADRIFRLMGQACAWAKQLPKSTIENRKLTEPAVGFEPTTC